MNQKLNLESLDRPSLSEYKLMDKIPIIVVIDNVRSGMNVGSIFRSSDGFAIEKIILLGISPRPPHKEISKTAIGATESVEWEYSADIGDQVDQWTADGYKILAVEQTSESIALSSLSIERAGRYVVIFGNEVDGVDDRLVSMADECIELAQYGTKHSLNVAVCAGIVLWHISTLMRT